MSEKERSPQICRATATDASAIAAVLHTAFLEYEPYYTPSAFAATTPGEEVIRQRFSEGPTWIAQQDVQMVGTVSAVLQGLRVYVRSMAVLPLARGLQLGTRLLAQVEQFAVEQGAHQLYLSTTPFLERAICLYEQFGFQRSEQGPLALFGTPLFTMVKVLHAEESEMR
jgi:GNAT superfamily N-acetyltransferase